MTTSRLAGVAMEMRGVKLDRSAVDDESRRFSGHAAVYGQRAAIGDPFRRGQGFYEIVARNAFAKSLADGDVVQLADHDPSKPIARMSAGTLRLASDDTGLAVDSDVVRTSYGDDMIANVRAGNVAGMSFGFQRLQDDWATETVERDGVETEVEVRTLLEVRLIEVSTTPFPAYGGTDAGVRSIRDARAVFDELDGEVRIGAELSAANLATLQKVCDMLNSMMSGKGPAAAGKDMPPEAKDTFPLDLAIRMRQMAERYDLPILT